MISGLAISERGGFAVGLLPLITNSETILSGYLAGLGTKNALPRRNPNRPKVGELRVGDHLSAIMGFAEQRDPGRHMCG